MKLLDIPLRTPNPLNGSHGHWRTDSARRKKQRKAVGLYWLARHGLKTLAPLGEFTVKLTRSAPSDGLDDDGLLASLKSVRDEVAHRLHVDDGPTSRVKWAYAQQRGKWGVRIEIVDG